MKLYCAVNTEEESTQLQNDLDHIIQWSNEWQIKFNHSKCAVLHLGTTNKNFNYTISGNILRSSDCERDLGVFISPHSRYGLSFSNHCAKTASKATILAQLFCIPLTTETPSF